MPEFLDAECLGDQCANWKGDNCSSQFEWMSANATVSENRDKSKPPFIDETKYVIYGQHCGNSINDELIAQRVEIIDATGVSMMGLVAITGRYGDMPVAINYAAQTGVIDIVSSSDGQIEL